MNLTLPNGFSLWRLEPHNVPNFHGVYNKSKLYNGLSMERNNGKSSSRAITFLVKSFELELSYRSQMNLQNCKTHNLVFLEFWDCQLPLDFFHFDVIPTFNHKETLEEWRQQPHHKLIKI